jgi:hypothetical protein
MGVSHERPARATETPTRKSSKGIFIVIAAPIALILFWILLVTMLPRFLH